jgi:hypothetical protein
VLRFAGRIDLQCLTDGNNALRCREEPVSDSNWKFWPFQPRFSLIAVIAVLVALLLAVAILRALLQWPRAESDTVVLIGILLLSLLPIMLALLDVLIERGGAIEYKGAKIDFSRSKEHGIVGITVSPNIGVRGVAVTDNGTAQILDALRLATSADLVVIDLEDGLAWWETRLFVLAAGAVRRGKPNKFVFIGKDANIEQQFQGWLYADELLSRMITAHPQYARSLQSAQAAANQWQLIEPSDPPIVGMPTTLPPVVTPPWLSGRLATTHSSMAFDHVTGLHNEFFAEQLLQSDLGAKIETQQGPLNITLTRLEDLLRPNLNKQFIDLNWPPERQLETFLRSDQTYFAITMTGKYSGLVSRAALSNQVLKAIVNGEKQT